MALSKYAAFVRNHPELIKYALESLEHKYDDSKTLKILMNILSLVDRKTLDLFEKTPFEGFAIEDNSHEGIIDTLSYYAFSDCLTDDALAFCNRLLELNPNKMEYYIQKEECLFFLGQHDEAIKVLDEAIAKHPFEVELFTEKARILKTLGRASECDEMYARAEGLDAYDYEVITYRLEQAFEAKNRSDVEDYIAKAVNSENEGAIIILADNFGCETAKFAQAHFILDQIEETKGADFLMKAMQEELDDLQICSDLCLKYLNDLYRQNKKFKQAFMMSAMIYEQKTYISARRGVDAYDEHKDMKKRAFKKVDKNFVSFSASEFEKIVTAPFEPVKGALPDVYKNYIADDPGGHSLEGDQELSMFIKRDSDGDLDIMWAYEL